MDDGFSAPLTKLQGKHGGKVWAGMFEESWVFDKIKLNNVSHHYGLDVLYDIVNIIAAGQSHYSFNGNGSISCLFSVIIRINKIA